MKKISSLIILLLATVAISLPAFSQDTLAKKPAKSNLIWVRESDIPPSALINLQRDSKIQRVEDKLEEVSQYVGIGKEIGSAVDTSLGALAYHIDRISKTNVGKFTMAMVAWKIIGEDAIGYLVGIVVLILFLGIWVWSWRKNFYRRKIPTRVKSLTWGERWYRPWRKYEVLEYKYFEKDSGSWGSGFWMDYGEASYFGHILALVIGLLIIITICF